MALAALTGHPLLEISVNYSETYSCLSVSYVFIESTQCQHHPDHFVGLYPLRRTFLVEYLRLLPQHGTPAPLQLQNPLIFSFHVPRYLIDFSWHVAASGSLEYSHFLQ